MKKNNEEHKKVYKFLKPFLGFLFLAYYRPKFVNKQYIPKEGPIIIVGNHVNILDQCLPIMSTKRMIHYMAKKEYFDGKFAWFFKTTGCISVNRAIHDQDAKERALNVLKKGEALGLFPEGTRNKTSELLLPFKMGAVSMAQKTGAVIVPFAITGEYKFWNNKLKIEYLEPFKVEPNEDLEAANDKLRNKILNYLEKNSR